MDRLPSGAIGNELITNDDQESTGLYADGRPRAMHTYNKLLYVPDVGPMFAPQGSTSWSGQNGTLKPIIISQETYEMTRFGTSIGSGSPGDYSGGGTCYDSLRHAVWVKSKGSSRMHRYNITSDTWTLNLSSSVSHDGTVSLEYISEHDCILWFSSFLQMVLL